MCGHANYTAASPQGLLIVLQTILRYEFGNVCLLQFRKMAEFHEKAPEIMETSTQDLQPSVICEAWKSHLKVAQACRTLAPGQVKAKPRDAGSRAMSCVAGHCAECCEKDSSE